MEKIRMSVRNLLVSLPIIAFTAQPAFAENCPTITMASVRIASVTTSDGYTWKVKFCQSSGNCNSTTTINVPTNTKVYHIGAKSIYFAWHPCSSRRFSGARLRPAEAKKILPFLRELATNEGTTLIDRKPVGPTSLTLKSPVQDHKIYPGVSYKSTIGITWSKYRNGEYGGFIIEYIEPGSPADLAGLKQWQIINEINGVRVTSYSGEYTDALITNLNNPVSDLDINIMNIGKVTLKVK